jgi:hypothetical protein
VIEMELKVDTIVNPALFEDEDTELVELAIAPEDEDKYPFVRPSSAPADLMDRPGRAIADELFVRQLFILNCYRLQV